MPTPELSNTGAMNRLIDEFLLGLSLKAGVANIGAVAKTLGSAVSSRVATGAAVQVAAANTARKAITFKNVHASVVCYIAETSGKATAALGFVLGVGAQVTFEYSSNAWFSFSATAGDLSIIEES